MVQKSSDNAIFFKGFVRTKQKKSIDKFKNATTAELKKYDDVKDLPEYAGILADDVILIDVDDSVQSDMLFKIVEDNELLCRVYETTRGKHFLFKNDRITRCRIHSLLAVGLEADIKLGSRNSYEVLKFDGKERPVIYDIFDGEVYQNIPSYLTPLPTGIRFFEMEAGDGRNQSMFNYILQLQSNDFTVDECRETLSMINKYILPDPLPDDEMEKILRDEAFEKPVFFSKGKFLFDKFAVFLKNNCHIKRINGSLHIFKDGIYIEGQSAIEAEMIKHIPSLSSKQRNEVIKYLNLIVAGVNLQNDAGIIAFKNGLYNINDETFTDFTPEKIVTNKIPWNWNPDAYSEICDKTLNKIACHSPEIRMLLEEVVGYTFFRRNELRKAFILIGDKANGKSTYLDMVQTTLGSVNTCALDLKELGERFKTAQLVNKLANIGDDIGDDFIPNPAVFKKLVSGDVINAERKGQEPFDFANYSKLLFSANRIPRIKDKSGAVLSRLVIIPFDASFSRNDPDFDPYIKYKLRSAESIEYLIQLGVKGLNRVLDNNGFTQSKRVDDELEAYAENNNPVLLFFKEVEEKEIENQSTKDVFLRYQLFCTENNFNPLSQIEFTKQVTKHYKFIVVKTRIGGKTPRIYKKSL